MKSIFKNKKAQQMGWTEIMYLIIGLMIVFFIVSSIMGVSWGEIIRGWIPKMNTTTNNDFNLINGTDESIAGVNVNAIVANELALHKEGINYGRLAADVCTLFGFGGAFGSNEYAGVDYQEAFNGDYQQSGVSDITSISLADDVTTAVVVNSAGQKVASVAVNTLGANKVYTLTSLTFGGSTPVTINSLGQVVSSNGQVWGTVGPGQRITAVLKGGTKITSQLGEDVVIASAKGVPKLISTSSRAFAFLSKTVNAAGYVTGGISVLCDVGAVVASTYALVGAEEEVASTGVASDAALAKLTVQVSKNYNSINEVYNKFYNKFLSSSNGLLVTDTPKIIASMTALTALKNKVFKLYLEYGSNTERQRGWGWLGWGSQFSDRESNELNGEISKYFKALSDLRKLLNGIDFSQYNSQELYPAVVETAVPKNP